MKRALSASPDRPRKGAHAQDSSPVRQSQLNSYAVALKLECAGASTGDLVRWMRETQVRGEPIYMSFAESLLRARIVAIELSDDGVLSFTAENTGYGIEALVNVLERVADHLTGTNGKVVKFKVKSVRRVY
jgi:hypothetical protein